MDTLADKLAALLSLTALKLVRLRVSVWYLGFVLWRLRQEHPELLPELPDCAFLDPNYQLAFVANLSNAFLRGMRYELFSDILELSGIEAQRILDSLREDGCASTIRIIAPLVAPMAAMIDPD